MDPLIKSLWYSYIGGVTRLNKWLFISDLLPDEVLEFNVMRYLGGTSSNWTSSCAVG